MIAKQSLMAYEQDFYMVGNLAMNRPNYRHAQNIEASGIRSAIILTYFIITEPSYHSKLLQKVLFPKFFLLFQLKHFARDY